MNKRLDEALTKVKALSEDEQQEAAEILLEFIEAREAEIVLTPEQIAEVEKRLEEDDVASDEEVREFFSRFKS
ncbi:MAG: hypothetical protein WDN48_14025 [Pseudolabrys sp.]